jgi:hypothetical protein
MKHLAWIPLLVAPLALVALVPAPALVACSGSGGADAGQPPTITLLTIPATASIGADGNYDLVATISFTSPASPVNSIQVLSQALGYSYTVTIAGAMTVNSGALPLSFPVTAASASGTQVDVTITLIDEAGAQSAPLSGTVTLE